jgi:hypothetical protein
MQGKLCFNGLGGLWYVVDIVDRRASPKSPEWPAQWRVARYQWGEQLALGRYPVHLAYGPEIVPMLQFSARTPEASVDVSDVECDFQHQ